MKKIRTEKEEFNDRKIEEEKKIINKHYATDKKLNKKWKFFKKYTFYYSRGAGIGICSVAARVGAISAPIILLIGDYWEPLPLIIFGSSSVIAGFLSLLFPETKGQKLPETIEEGENFGK